jgi:hypothetical protein
MIVKRSGESAFRLSQTEEADSLRMKPFEVTTLRRLPGHEPNLLRRHQLLLLQNTHQPVHPGLIDVD